MRRAYGNWNSMARSRGNERSSGFLRSPSLLTSDFFQVFDMISEYCHAHVEEGRHLSDASLLLARIYHSPTADGLFRESFFRKIIGATASARLRRLRIDVVETGSNMRKGDE